MNYIHKQPVESPLVRAKLLPPSPSPLSLSLYKSDLRERERGEGVGGGKGVTWMYYIYKVMYRKKEEGIFYAHRERGTLTLCGALLADRSSGALLADRSSGA